MAIHIRNGILTDPDVAQRSNIQGGQSKDALTGIPEQAQIDLKHNNKVVGRRGHNIHVDDEDMILEPRLNMFVNPRHKRKAAGSVLEERKERVKMHRDPHSCYV
jgi:hypothetical protein